MSDRDSEALEQAVAMLRKFAENLTAAFRRIDDLRQASVANVHLTMALVAELSGVDGSKYAAIAKAVRTMQESLESEQSTELAQKYLSDFASALEQTSAKLAGPVGSKESVDPQEPARTFLKNWTDKTKH